MKYVGEEFIAKKPYPFLKDWEDEDGSYDITEGEKVRVESYEDGRYKLVNLSLDTAGLAWVAVTEEELEKIKG